MSRHIPRLGGSRAPRQRTAPARPSKSFLPYLWLALGVLCPGVGISHDHGHEPASPQFSAVLRQGRDPSQIHHDLDEAGLRSKARQLAAAGLLLSEFEVTSSADGKARRYTGIWRRGAGGYLLETGLRRGELQRRLGKPQRQTLRLVDFEVFVEDGSTLYAGLWRRGSERQVLQTARNAEAFEDLRRRMSRRGYRLVDLECHEQTGTYHGLWGQSPLEGEILDLELPWTDFKRLLLERAKKGMQVDDLEIYETGGQTVYSGVWHRESGAYWNWIGFFRHCLDEKVDWLGLDPAGKEQKDEPTCVPPRDPASQSSAPGNGPGLDPGRVAPHEIPALRVIDIELTRELPPPAAGDPQDPPNPIRHNGVLHDDGGPGG